MKKPWFLYVLECSDGTLYTGITNDVRARLLTHNSGKGAKYTRGRRPVVLMAVFEYADKSGAAKAEYAFKKMPRPEKLRQFSSSYSVRSMYVKK